jgi:hypothetical protein
MLSYGGAERAEELNTFVLPGAYEILGSDANEYSEYAMTTRIRFYPLSFIPQRAVYD